MEEFQEERFQRKGHSLESKFETTYKYIKLQEKRKKIQSQHFKQLHKIYIVIIVTILIPFFIFKIDPIYRFNNINNSETGNIVSLSLKYTIISWKSRFKLL